MSQPPDPFPPLPPVPPDGPPPRSPEPLGYAGRYMQEPGHVFGNVVGNAVMGAVVMFFAPIVGSFAAYAIASATNGAEMAFLPVLAAPLAALGWGAVAATKPRWRGFLTGMLITIGAAILLIGACFAMVFGTKW